ncbi:MAG TPA: NTP transferase domain-containing protein [Ilumatobacter sp.]|nr:NTP transferase domain-containing protein [Ilumatobacter sp.]
MTAGVVLTGGVSRRMGRDKALVEVDGVAMAARVAAALVDAGCNPVWCQGGDAMALAATGLAVHADSAPGQGPVPAILDALAALPSGASGLVVAACDLPDLTADAVRLLLTDAHHVSIHRWGGCAAGAALDDRWGGAHDDRNRRAPVALAVAGAPQLVSCWPAAVRGELARLVAEGARSYRQVLAALDARLIETPPAIVRNVNAPGDLQP